MCNFVKRKFIVSMKIPSLPDFRVNCSYAFEGVGVDFARPLCVKVFIVEIENLKKCSLLLFTYAMVRVLHLEITQDLSVNTLILA